MSVSSSKTQDQASGRRKLAISPEMVLNLVAQSQPILHNIQSLLRRMSPPTKRRKTNSATAEEIVFDPEARQDYLTGFHKRKLQRAKHAKEVAEKKAQAERIEERRKESLLLKLKVLYSNPSSVTRRKETRTRSSHCRSQCTDKTCRAIGGSSLCKRR